MVQTSQKRPALITSPISKMLFLILLFALVPSLLAAPSQPNITSAISSTTTAPTSTPTACHAKTFNKPWILSDITIFTPSGQEASSSQHGSISFHFRDTNARLKLETDCMGEVINGTCQADDGGYVLCEHETVAFKLAGNLIMMERAFKDHCLGPAPNNRGVAFGQNNTHMVMANQTSGLLASQRKLLVEITAEIA